MWHVKGSLLLSLSWMPANLMYPRKEDTKQAHCIQYTLLRIYSITHYTNHGAQLQAVTSRPIDAGLHTQCVYPNLFRVLGQGCFCMPMYTLQLVSVGLQCASPRAAPRHQSIMPHHAMVPTAPAVLTAVLN